MILKKICKHKLPNPGKLKPEKLPDAEPTATVRTTRAEFDRSFDPDPPSTMYDSDLPDLSIDYDEIGNFNYDANSNYYTSDSSFDSYSDSYARFKGLQPDYKPDDGVTDRSSTLREVIHKFTRDRFRELFDHKWSKVNHLLSAHTISKSSKYF